MATPVPIGFGPWAIALLVHTGKGTSKRQTEIRIETYPELVPWAHRQGGQPGWVIAMMVGVFESWRAALAFYHQWLQPTRGKTRRIQRGLELHEQWWKPYGLHMWIQSKTLEQVETEAAAPPAQKYAGLKRSRAAMALQTSLDELDTGVPISMAVVKNIQQLRASRK
jgi:hypothetical protein